MACLAVDSPPSDSDSFSRQHRLYAMMDVGDEYLHGNDARRWLEEGVSWPPCTAVASLPGANFEHYAQRYALTDGERADEGEAWSTDAAGLLHRHVPSSVYCSAPVAIPGARGRDRGAPTRDEAREREATLARIERELLAAQRHQSDRRSPLRPTRPAPLAPTALPVLDFDQLSAKERALLPSDDSSSDGYQLLTHRYMQAAVLGELSDCAALGRAHTVLVNDSRLLSISNAVVVGNNNNIHGHNNLIIGDNNAVHGDNNTSRGDRNKLFGRHCTNHDAGDSGTVQGGNSTRISMRGSMLSSLSARNVTRDDVANQYRLRLTRERSEQSLGKTRWHLTDSDDNESSTTNEDTTTTTKDGPPPLPAPPPPFIVDGRPTAPAVPRALTSSEVDEACGHSRHHQRRRRRRRQRTSKEK
jgi:hypothetical protein